MVASATLLKIWSFRLKMNDEGTTKKWSPQLRADVEGLIQRLGQLAPDDEIATDADLERDPVAKFILVATGEVIAEFANSSRQQPNRIVE